MSNQNKLQIKLNLFDRFVGYFSPRSLLRRKKARIMNEFFARKYEGATAGRRTDGWITTGGSANSELVGSKGRLRDRARDLVRNNPYAARGVQVITNNVVGKGIMAKIHLDTRAQVSTKEKTIQKTWDSWANTKAIDYEGIHNLFSMQRLCMRSVVEGGEVLIRRRRVGQRTAIAKDGSTVKLPPIQLQVLEGDFLAANHVSRRAENGNHIIQGVEIDSAGKKVAYHLYKTHPGNITLDIASTFDTVRVPAEDILHLYRVDRPGQLSGVTWLADIILRLRDFDLYEDAQLKRQQCAAMFTAFVHDLEAFDEEEETEAEDEIGEKMEPGRIELLPPGKDVKLADPPGADNYKEYTTVVLRSIASGLGITYESLTGDLTEVNFSSGRMGWLEMQRNIETWRMLIMLNQFLEPLFDWFKESLELIALKAPNARAIFTPPRREMISPVEETKALKEAVRSGFKSLPAALMEQGVDPETHYQELKESNDRLDDLGLILDSDPRKVNNKGDLHETEASTDDGDDSQN